MASYKVLLTESAEAEFRASPFPFRRQILQAFFKLKDDPRPPSSQADVSGDRLIFVHGWWVTYDIDDATATVTILCVRRKIRARKQDEFP